MIRELAESGFDDAAMRRIMGAIDKVGSEFEMSRKSTALVPIESSAYRAVMEYLACKSLEGYSRETLSAYHCILSNFFSTLKKNVEDIDSTAIRMYLYQYQAHRRVSNRTLDHLRITISCFFHWALAEGKIGQDPSLAIKPIKYVVKPKPSLSQIEMEYVRKNLYGAREKAIIETFYSTGCRVSELCGMKKADVNWDNATVQVFGKGGKYRTAFLNAKAIVSISDYLASRPDDNEFLFVSERKPHGQLKRAAVEKIIRAVSRRSFGLTGVHITPHVFRHTTISTALRNGMSLQNVARMVGHEEVKTTMYYAKIDNTDVKHDHERCVI